MKFEIPYYHDYISEELADYLISESKPIDKIDDLCEVGTGQIPETLESFEALQFLCELYRELEPDLKKILNQRIKDRKFIDERVRACYEFNKNHKHDIFDSEYKTIIGLEDAQGRIVIGPHSNNFCQSRKDKNAIAPIPEFLKGPHVTLFGPPGNAKMAINAMNTYHRKLKGEPEIIEKLLSTHKGNPKWGADDEDSKTPLRDDLLNSAINLTACFEGKLSYEENGKKYELAKDHLSIPIKRFPGLALPCTFLFYKKNPIPLHLYDFALHLFKNRHNPKALVFYVPKLENEEEARYIHKMVFLAESKIMQHNHDYEFGSIRLMVVLENPRAILRTHEIIDELFPYFVGASLGWHDYLGSTARLFKEDGNYRIPVKADPDIVIKYIKASHNLLSDVVGSRGGIKVGGMYGILPLDGDINSESFQITIKGYIKDVITQMKRNLTGFWVAHPDFVRLGIAMVEAWKFRTEGQPGYLTDLIKSLLQPQYHQEILEFVEKKDIDSLDKNDPNYVRSLIVADIKESDFIANNHPDEIRYNVFQSLQYLTDWLCGNGCVALPAHVNGVAVRVMDDLATAERSRWEVWHEIYHGRFSVEDFLKIVFEEYHFIRKDLSNENKIVQVKWNESTEKWYPVALKLMVQLMTSKNPVEFATELLMPFTIDSVRSSADPLTKAKTIDQNKFQLDAYIERYMYYFEICGCSRFATEMAKSLALDLIKVNEAILSFTKDEIIEAAEFHGNIGEDKKTLDQQALAEQALVINESEDLKTELREQGDIYKQIFGMKFLISAKNKSAKELIEVQSLRLQNSQEQEIGNAQVALWEISQKRINERPLNNLTNKIESIRQKHQVRAASVSLNVHGAPQELNFGECKSDEWFELASLSKTVAAAFALEYFSNKKIALEASVDKLLKKYNSPFSFNNDKLQIKHLLNHSAMNLHYVKGYELGKPMPSTEELMKEVKIICEPGSEFHYSGGGFIVLQYIIELIEKKPIHEVTHDFMTGMSFLQTNLRGPEYATGYFDNGEKVPGTRLMFPAMAAGALGSSSAMAQFLNQLTSAFHNIEGSKLVSHDTAVQMLYGTDNGCREFMGCDMGLGIFIAEAGDNRLAIHQGANEGFRSLFIHCFSGPDCGNGFVIFCNADNKGMLFNAEVAQEILKEFYISGIDFNQFKNLFDFKNVSQENIVNQGYKKLIFNAFLPSLPEEIERSSMRDPFADYNLLAKAKITKVSNQKFARASNLISEYLPVFDPELFGKQGKIMDSWETARHNRNKFDFIELELNDISEINYASLSTQYHDGNQAEFVRILGRETTRQDWVEIVPLQKMNGHSFINLKLASGESLFDAVRIEMYPDGGLTRVGLFDELPQNDKLKFSMKVSERFQESIPVTKKPLSLKYTEKHASIQRNKKKLRINYSGMAFGAKIVSATNEHYSPAAQLLSPYPAINMFDGLESARSRKKDNFERVAIQLAEVIKIKRIILDFKYFVNNNPDEVSIEAFIEGGWKVIVPKTNVKAYAGNKKEFIINDESKYALIRINIYPDGGINRLFVFAD